MKVMTSAGKRRKNAVKCAMETGCGKEGVSWKNAENDGERTISAWDVGAQMADDEKQAGISGSRNRQPNSTWNRRNAVTIRIATGFTAFQNGLWEGYQETFSKKMKASEWAFDMIKEAF